MANGITRHRSELLHCEHFIKDKKFMYIQQGLRVLIFIGYFFGCSSVVEDPDSPSLVNLPNTATVSEISDTGTVIFTLQSAAQFELISQYPDATSEAFQYDARSKTIIIKNGGLLDYDGNHRTFVMPFQEQQSLPLKKRRKRAAGITEDLLLVIQLEAVNEAGSLASLGFLGCCDGVNTLKWIVPVCSAVELFILVVCLAISITCFIKKSNRNAVEVFRQEK